MRLVTQLLERWGHIGVALLVLVENILPPIPSEVILPFAGFLTRKGPLTLPGVVISSTIGSLLGACLLYWIGRALGKRRLFELARHPFFPVNEAGLQKAAAWFARYGPWTVFFCRMVPTVRSLISIPAGLSRMRLASFLAYSAAGTLIWNAALIVLGAVLGAAWPRITAWLRYLDWLVLIGLVAVLIGLFRYKRARRSEG